jgi:crotonobetainyl-CoA:carnitine CoA-transferase CaiB-like acyl-CoA transferase
MRRSDSRVSYDLLDGVSVIEVAMYAFAPSAGAVLAEWGADVVKVVPPKVGDPMMGNIIAGLPRKDVGVAFMWQILNRGKRCVAVDISTDAGREVLRDMVVGADVFITNLLPSARKRFAIDPEDLATVNGRLIYARATGHGPRGPEREDGGFDHTDFWARSGIAHAASQVSDEFMPQPGPALGDLSAGAFLAGAIAAALYRRTRSGQGAVVDVSLLSSGMWVAQPAVVASQLYDVPTIPRARHADLPNPLVAAYTTRDHRQIYVAGIRTEGHFENFCEVINRQDLLDDPRFATGIDRYKNRRQLIGMLDETFAERDLVGWVKAFEGLDTPWVVVNTAGEAAVDRQVIANNYLTAVDGPGTAFSLVPNPAQFDDAPPAISAAPEHGQHTEEVLLQLGRSWSDIAALQASETIP